MEWNDQMIRAVFGPVIVAALAVGIVIFSLVFWFSRNAGRPRWLAAIFGLVALVTYFVVGNVILMLSLFGGFMH